MRDFYYLVKIGKRILLYPLPKSKLRGSFDEKFRELRLS